MPDIDLDAIEKAADDATRGEWTVNGRFIECDGEPFAIVPLDANATFIAMCDPDAVKAMVARIRELETASRADAVMRPIAERAAEYIAAFQKAVAITGIEWRAPHTTEQDGDIVFKWRNGDRNLSITFDALEAWYTTWSDERRTCDGEALGRGTQVALWEWLYHDS